MRTKLLSVLLSLAMLLPCAALSSCEKPPEKFSEYSFDYFDTVTTITGYAESQEAFDEIAEDVLAELGEYHRLFTIYHRFEGLENLCTVNELADGQHRTVTVFKFEILFERIRFKILKFTVNRIEKLHRMEHIGDVSAAK